MARRVSSTPYFDAAMQATLALSALAVLVLVAAPSRPSGFIEPYGDEVHRTVLADHPVSGEGRFRLSLLRGDGMFGPGALRVAAAVERGGRERLGALSPDLPRDADVVVACPRPADCRFHVLRWSVRPDQTWRLNALFADRPLSEGPTDWLGTMSSSAEPRGFAPAARPLMAAGALGPRAVASTTVALALLSPVMLLIWAAVTGPARGWSSVTQAALLMPVAVLILFWPVSFLIALFTGAVVVERIVLVLIVWVALVLWRGRVLARRSAAEPPAARGPSGPFSPPVRGA